MKFGGKYPGEDVFVKLRQEMKLRGFSQKTIKSYLYYITQCIEFANKNAKSVTSADVRAYLEYLSDTNHSSSTLNTVYSALLFYFGKILRRKFFTHIPRAKKDKKLPRE